MGEKVKRLLIKQCPDPLMWYADKVGQTVPYLGNKYGTHTSREDSGFINIVKEADAEIIEADVIEAHRLTRVEVIDEKGRSYVGWDDRNEVKISVQDGGLTLKIFISKKERYGK